MNISKMKLIRMQQGLRQFDVSRVVGISEPYLSKIETGRVRPSENLLQKIATVLGVDCEKLREKHHAGHTTNVEK